MLKQGCSTNSGNWTVGLEAGAQYGYKLLFIMLMAGLGAAVLQTLSLRLGLATLTQLGRPQLRYPCVELSVRPVESFQVRSSRSCHGSSAKAYCGYEESPSPKDVKQVEAR